MLDSFTQVVFLVVAYYVASFCLVSIIIWAGLSYLGSTHGRREVRDASVYFLTICVLALLCSSSG